MKSHRPRKRFGQNFLHDPGVLTRIVAAIAPQPGERLIEIGPGLGALTSHILSLAKQLTVVELDRDLIAPLKERCAGAGELKIIQADALKLDFCSLQEDKGKIRLFGNLPYNISTPLLFHLFEQIHCIQDMHFMLQKEVVERMVAVPGTKRYGRLSVMVQFYCRAEMLFTVGPGAFHPTPKVASAVVRLIPHPSPPVKVRSSTLFSKLVAEAFSQRRKTLRNTLKQRFSPEQLLEAGIDPSSRAEQLSLEQFARLAELESEPGNK